MCFSPIIAIMVEQTAKFIAIGVNAQFVGEAQSDTTVRQRVIDQEYHSVFISPENLLCNWHVAFIAIQKQTGFCGC